MTELSFKQFVPSEICLKCNGCCRYKEQDSVWRPKLGQNDRQSLAALITGADVLDSQGYIKTIQTCGENLCRFFNPADHACGIYGQRPLECSLYPFIISQTSDALKVYVHLSCPYVQDHQPFEAFDTYVAYLKNFFGRQDVRQFLNNNKAMFHDYTDFAPELLHLFDLLPL